MPSAPPVNSASDLTRAELAMYEGRAHEAEGICLDVLARTPGHMGATALRGAAILQRGDAASALPLLRHVAVPGAPAQWFANLRAACHMLLLYADAAEAGLASLRATSVRTPELLAGAAQSLTSAGRLAEGRALFDEALALRPDDAGARMGRAYTALAAGDWLAGWPDYEYRLQALPVPLPELPGERWDGRERPGAVVALVSEQGIGDALQFARFVPLVAARCGGVAVACQTGLVPLLRDLPGVVACVDRVPHLPAVAAHATFGSLPGLLGVTPRTVPAAPYLAADPARSAAWRGRLGAGPRVGVVWSGSPSYAADARRSIALERLRRLLAVPGVAFVSLQKDPSAADRARFGELGLHDPSAELDGFDATAALVASLDLVISVDTAVAHLAGALGCPVWLLLMEPADWRWLRGRTDSPWYPSARLFRQPVPGDWDSVLVAVAAALAVRVGLREAALRGAARGG